jgi:hypothetical protein
MISDFRPLEPEALYLVLQELMRALPNGLHRLASAGNPEVTLGAGNQQILCNRPGLDAASATIQDLVAVGLAQKRYLLGKLDPQINMPRISGNQALFNPSA